MFLEFDQVEFAPNIHINVSVDVFLAGDWTTGPEDVFRAWVEVNDAREITLLPDCADTIHGGNESAAFMAGRWMTISADLTAFTRARLMLGLQSSSAGSDKAVYIDNFKVVGGGTKNEIWCLAVSMTVPFDRASTASTPSKTVPFIAACLSIRTTSRCGPRRLARLCSKRRPRRRPR